MNSDFPSELSSEELLEVVRGKSKIESSLPWGEFDDFMYQIGLVKDEYKCPRPHLWFIYINWKKITVDSEKIRLYYIFDSLVGDRLDKFRNYRNTVTAYRCNKEVAWLSAKKRQELKNLIKHLGPELLKKRPKLKK